MDAPEMDAPSWSFRRVSKPRASAFAVVLTLLFGAAFLLSIDLDQGLTRSFLRNRLPRKLGEFSANGNTYKTFTFPKTEVLIERMGSKVSAKAAAVRVGKSAPALVVLSETEARSPSFEQESGASVKSKRELSLLAGNDSSDQDPALISPKSSAEGSLGVSLEQSTVMSLEELVREQLSGKSKGAVKSTGVATKVQKDSQEQKVTAQQSTEKSSRQVSNEASVEPLKSSAECIRDADGSDICHYGGAVCYDSGQKKLVLIDDDRRGEQFSSAIIFQDGRWTQGRLPPDSKWPLPINNKIEGVWDGQEVLSNATFLAGAMWIVRPETDNTNHIWHNGLSFTGLLQAQLRNTSGVFPPLDHVLVLNLTAADAGYTDYNMGMLSIVSQNHTKLLFTKDLPKDKRLLCAKRGALTSYKPSWSTGPLDASELRARAYDHLKIPEVNKADWRRVTIVNRPQGFPRHVENVEEIVRMLKDLGLEVHLMQEVPGQARSFPEQVSTMAETGILIAPHGGGLANLAWLPENAAVIELFPNKCVQTEYRNMAAVRNLVYFGVEAVNYTHPQALAEFSPEEIARCQGLHSIDHSHDGVCNQLVKNFPFEVPVAELKRTIEHALEHFFTLEVPFPLQKRR